MWKTKRKSIAVSILALLGGTALTIGIFANGNTFAQWSSGSTSFLDSIIRVGEEELEPPTISTLELPIATLAEDYSIRLEGTGRNVTHEITSGALPEGLTITAQGTIQGIPSIRGSYSFTVTKSNAAGSVSQGYTLEVIYGAPTITTTELIVSKNVPFTGAIAGEGEMVTYELLSGSLPTGLSFSIETGVISGTTALLGDYPITVRKTNEGGSVTADIMVRVKIAPPIIITTSLPNANVGTPYQTIIQAEGEEIVFSAVNLPSWLTLNPATGELTGSPTVIEAKSFTIRATNDGGSASANYVLTTRDILPSITTPSLPDGEVGVAYNATVEATPSDVVFTVDNPVLFPSGLTLSSTGVISGTPRFSGTFEFTINATRNYVTAKKTYTVFIETDGPTITTNSLPDAVHRVNYSARLNGKGENSTYSISAGALPPGISIIPDSGIFYGTPSTSAYGLYTFTVIKTNEKGSFSKELSIFVNYEVPTLSSWSVPIGRLGVAYTTGTPGGFGEGATYSIIQGTLPAGLTLNAATGVVSGTPTELGDFPITLEKRNAAGFATNQRTLTITEIPPVFTTTSYPEAYVGIPYEFQVNATGPGITYTVTDYSGFLPAGLSFDSTTGIISGTPTTVGNKYVRIEATNTGGTAVLFAMFYVRSAAPTQFITTELPRAIEGVPYFAQLEADGANLTYSVNTAGFALPSGLTLNATTGVISGTPTQVISRNVTFIARNNGGSVQKALLLAVDPAPPTITTEEFPNGNIGTSYGFTPTGAGTGTWSLTAGTLPNGLSLANGNGRIQGNPTVYGTFNFTLTKTNVSGTVSKSFTIRIFYATPTITTNSLADGQIGVAYNRALAGAGTGVTYSISAGQLPPGYSINSSTGTITGQATQLGTFTFTVKKANVDEYVEKELSITITDAAPTLPSTSRINMTEGVYFEYTLPGTGANATIEIINNGVLPEGLTLNSTTGVISGISTEIGIKTLMFRKTNSGGSVQQVYTFSVNDVAPTLTTTALPQGIAGVPYSYTVETTGKNLTFSAASLPAGLTINTTTGVISGTVATARTANVRITVTNSGGSVNQLYSLVIAAS